MFLLYIKPLFLLLLFTDKILEQSIEQNPGSHVEPKREF